MVGHKMPSPDDPKPVFVPVVHVEYKMNDSDDEEDDTYQTRKSIETAEKALQTKFFINAADKASFEASKKGAFVPPEIAGAKTEPGAPAEAAAAPAVPVVEKAAAEEVVPPELGNVF